MKKRVVITGMGAVSPNGVGNANFTSSLLAGRSGVRRITRFDASDLPMQIAGEVPDFEELAWVDAHERKHLSRSQTGRATRFLPTASYVCGCTAANSP